MRVSTTSEANVRDLAEAASTHAKVTNRAWLTTVGAALILLLPSPTAKNLLNQPCYDLPLGVAKCVAEDVFFPVGFVLLATLAVAFATAHAQQIRVHDRIQLAIGEAATDTRELFDLLRLSSVSRIAPLAELPGDVLRWFRGGTKPTPWRGAKLLYWLLRVVVALVMYAVPSIALTTSFFNAKHSRPSLQVPLWIVFAVAALALMVAAVADIAYSWKTSRYVGAKAS